MATPSVLHGLPEWRRTGRTANAAYKREPRCTETVQRLRPVALGSSTTQSHPDSEMRFTATSFAALAAGLVAGVSASPVAEKDWKYTLGWNGTILDPLAIGIPQDGTSARSLEARTPGGVFICTNINFSGTCGYAVQPLGVCITLTSPWYRTISSFGPDPGATCFAYSQNSCAEAQWEFTYPGDGTGGLGTNDPWNDQITNFMCE
ncbi:unnamed protein product [Mycena citricolor]|uniref:Uncharacterized protein n=1 Tax=Mycena citricolor TaxID=2018698 RepID=A0AAD2H0F4_9AGAR|nr:unnamed protein product [Mycena citricolor]